MPDPTDEARELAMQFRLPGELTMSRMHCEALAALIAKVRTEAGRWQPIETAPKDGTHVLLANKAGASEGGWLSDIDHGADWEGQIGMAGWWRADGTDWPCTHWQPLPAAPSASPAEAPAAPWTPEAIAVLGAAQPVAPAWQAAAGVQGEVAEFSDDDFAFMTRAINAFDRITSGVTETSDDRLFAKTSPRKMTINDAKALAAAFGPGLRKLRDKLYAAPAVERGVAEE